MIVVVPLVWGLLADGSRACPMFGTPTVAEIEGDQHAAHPSGARAPYGVSGRTALAVREAPRQPR